MVKTFEFEIDLFIIYIIRKKQQKNNTIDCDFLRFS